MGADPHILFLYGNDEYAIARRLREFASMFTNASEAEMNTAHVDARTMTEDQWVNAVNSMPFLAKQRLVILENPSGRFGRSKPKRGDAAEADKQDGTAEPAGPQAEATPAAEAREKFLRSLLGIPPTTQLVIWEPVEIRYQWNPARRQHELKEPQHWLITWMKKQGLGLERFALPRADEMPGWIIKYARAQGGEIAVTAASRLADMVGTDTRQAAQEVTKLLTYVNWSRPVTAADVETLSPLTAAPDVFKMVDALATGNGKLAQRLLHRLLEFQDPFSTWGMIVRQFRYLVVAREVIDAGGGEPEAIRALGEAEGKPVQLFVARNALGQARGFTMPKLEIIYHRLLEIDEGAKTGRMPLDLALDVLVAELAG